MNLAPGANAFRYIALVLMIAVGSVLFVPLPAAAGGYPPCAWPQLPPPIAMNPKCSQWVSPYEDPAYLKVRIGAIVPEGPHGAAYYFANYLVPPANAREAEVAGGSADAVFIDWVDVWEDGTMGLSHCQVGKHVPFGEGGYCLLEGISKPTAVLGLAICFLDKAKKMQLRLVGFEGHQVLSDAPYPRKCGTP